MASLIEAALDRVYASFLLDGPEVVGIVMSKDITCTIEGASQYAGPLRGRRALIEMLREWNEQTGGAFHLAPGDPTWAADGTLTVPVRAQGRRRDRSLDTKLVTSMRFRAGLIASATVHIDEGDAWDAFWA